MTVKKPQNLKAHGGRWGPGKVHYVENPRSPYAMCGRHVYGEVVDAKDNPATCKHCIAVSTGQRKPS